MSFKKIVVPLTGADDDRAALAAAFVVARPFCGHVVALFVTPDPAEAVPFVGMPISPEVLQQVIESAGVIARTALAAARANLKTAAKAAGVAIVESPAPAEAVTCSFCEMQGSFVSGIAEAAKLADLLVFGPATTEGGPDVSGAVIETLTRGTRPLLLTPHASVVDLLPKIVIGWDGGNAAARALTASLPLLAHAGSVEIWSVQRMPEDSAMLDAPAAYLRLHGIAANTRVIDPAGAAPGVVLLSEAEAVGASLLVLGGYGHSRLSETLFGGTTVHIAAHATIPLFMVH